MSGTEGTVRLDHFLRTGFEMFTAAGEGGYVAEKAEGQTGWLFPVGDEVHELGYAHMFQDMLEAWEAGREPMETFYDGYVVNAVMDACYKSMRSGRWEAVEIEERPADTPKKGRKRPQEARTAPGKGSGRGVARTGRQKAEKADLVVIKTERLPDGRTKVILKDKATGRIIERMQ